MDGGLDGSHPYGLMGCVWTSCLLLLLVLCCCYIIWEKDAFLGNQNFMCGPLMFLKYIFKFWLRIDVLC